jgi:3-oxoadipate enol-lactonase
MPFAPVNGTQIYYEVTGKGPAVLFAHGQGGNHLSWWQQVPFFARYYTCITFDHRAFGFSADADGRGRSGFGADAVGLLDHLGIDDVRVVAHSMGGRSAIAVALRTPERCKALVLAGTNGGVTSEAIRQGQREAAAARNGRGLGAFSAAEAFRREQPALYFLLKQVSGLNPPRPPDFLRPPVLNTTSPNRGPVHERLIASGIPVFYLVGEHDAITPPRVIELCHRLLPGSRYQVIEGSGHSAYWEKADVFNERVLAFLQEVAP